MPKPFDGQNRNALHIHLSMQDMNGENLFYDEDEEHNLSEKARNFIGGILKYARATSIIMASNFNSYKAYVAEMEAPISIGWDMENRSSMVRVPYAYNPNSKRIELRSADPAGNIYLQMATMIGMGLQGIREGLDCGKPDAGNNYRGKRKRRLWDRKSLPKCMFEALVEAERSTFLKDLLGEQIYNNYLAIKTEDWEEHRTRVTPREHDKYLSI
jgi:glutamine synthetase